MNGPAAIDEAMIYQCPHCRVELEARDDDGWTGWRLCPACDQPLFPPDPSERFLAPWKSTGSTRDELRRDHADKAFSAPGLPTEGRPAARWNPQFEPFDRSRAPRSGGWFRRGLTISLGFSLFAIMVGFLEESTLTMGASSLTSLVLFLLLMRPVHRD